MRSIGTVSKPVNSNRGTMITSVLFYEDKDCTVLTKKFIGDSIKDADDYFSQVLHEEDGAYIHATYIDDEDTTIHHRTEAL